MGAETGDSSYFNPQPKAGSFDFITQNQLEILRRDDPSAAYAAYEKDLQLKAE